jgi:hypothetical protein
MIKSRDVFAIATTSGKAYSQFVKKIRPTGSLIRVFPGAYNKLLGLYALVREKTNFWIFFLYRQL